MLLFVRIIPGFTISRSFTVCLFCVLRHRLFCVFFCSPGVVRASHRIDHLGKLYDLLLHHHHLLEHSAVLPHRFQYRVFAVKIHHLQTGRSLIRHLWVKKTKLVKLQGRFILAGFAVWRCLLC